VITQGMTNAQRRAAALRACLAVLIILSIAAIAGAPILHLFGISLPAFQAGGGLIILLMGLQMMKGQSNKTSYSPDDTENEDTILVPFAMPLLAGPGAIATVITLTAKHDTVLSYGSIYLAIFILVIVLFVSLLGASWIGGHIGKRGQKMFVQFMGLILVAVGAELILGGLRRYFEIAPAGMG
ncbi:MAG: MarC family protein, partial [Planctomycetota bacterium]